MKARFIVATTRVGIYRNPRKRHPWIVRWFGEYDPATGTKRRYSKSFRLKREAEGFQAHKQAEFNKGGQRDRPVEITLSEFCRKYVKRRRHEWAESTRLNVDQLSKRLLAHFGAEALIATVTTDRATAFWAQMERVRPGYEGQQLSRASRNWLLRYAKPMFKYAVEWSHLSRNPFAEIKAIRVGKKHHSKWHYVTPEQYRALVEVAPMLSRTHLVLGLVSCSI